MSKCKKCGAEVNWVPTEGGGFLPPQNPDGSRHTCSDVSTKQSPQPPTKTGNENPTTTVIGRLDGYDATSATVMKKDGKPHRYAITIDRCRAWENAGYPKEGDPLNPVWLKIALTKTNFIQSADPVDAPDWQYEVPKPDLKPVSTVAEKAKAAGFDVPAETHQPTNVSGSEPANIPAINQSPNTAPKAKEPAPTTTPIKTGGTPSRDQLIAIQSCAKVVAEVFIHCTAPGSQDFDAAMDIIITRAIHDADTIMTASGV